MTTIGHAPAAKRFVDIEYALRWAYRDELPKRQHGGSSWIAGTPLTPVRVNFSDIGEYFRREPGFPEAAGEPHPDAFLIEAAAKGLEAWRGHGFGPDPAQSGLMHGIDHMDIDHVQAGISRSPAIRSMLKPLRSPATSIMW